MAWQDIPATDVQANSPVGSSLMGRIRGNLVRLFEDCLWSLLWSDYKGSTGPWDDPGSYNAAVNDGESWKTKVIGPIVIIPDAAATLKMKIRIKPDDDTGSPRRTQAVRFVTADVTNGGIVDEGTAYYFTANGFVDLELTMTVAHWGMYCPCIQLFDAAGTVIDPAEWTITRWALYVDTWS